MSSEPSWFPVDGMPEFKALHENTRADVCVVGAGIAGLSTAYLLLKAGKHVVVLESGGVASGETARTSAHLSNALDDRYTRLQKLFGERGAQLAAESHTAAIKRIEAIARAEGIHCDFQRVDGYLFTPPGDSADALKEELAAAYMAGLRDVEPMLRAPLPSYDTGPCLRFPRQAQFHPLKYVTGLARAIRRLRGRIFVHSHVKSFESGKLARATTREGLTVEANALVVATNTPVNDRVTIHTKQYPYRTYIVGFKVPAGAIPRALYWDTLTPYHYVRLQDISESEQLLIVGGEDHKTGQARDEPERFGRLEAWARERFPEAGETAYRWSGQVMEPMDALAYIGRNPGDENVYVVTGDSGHGLTHGTIAGILLTDLILGRDNPWAEIYEPSRKTLKTAGTFVRENVNVAVQYADWLTPGEVKSADDVQPGEGAILRSGLKKLAIYRDERGRLHQRSAVCPHLGCIVHWNRAEKTWDCPCHGSRFGLGGKILNGPSAGPLSLVDE